MKRLLDTLLVLLSAPLWIPLALAVALAVACSMGRPVIFRQDRAGKGGRAFRFMKFRTMRAGEGSDAERTTRLGRFLRATSLDELPQLLHVLSGKMSLVGPRPLPVRYLPRYSPEQARRHEVRPGITGWAQVNGYRGITDEVWKMEKRVEFDVWYIEHWHFFLDLKIIVRTLMNAVHGEKNAF